MPRKRSNPRSRVVHRETLTDALEAYLAGDDAVLTNDALLHEVSVELYFVWRVQLSEPEQERMKLLRHRVDEWRGRKYECQE